MAEPRGVAEEARSAPTDAVPVAVTAARAAQQGWSSLPVTERIAHLAHLRLEIAERAEDIVEEIARDLRRHPAEGFGHDLLPVLLSLRWHERVGRRALAPERPGRLLAAAVGMRSRIERRPYGVVAAITPGNYPFNLSLLPAIPALLAGNTIVLKPSELAPGVAGVLRRLLDAAFPPGVASVLLGDGSAGRALMRAGIDKVCFVGSRATGREVAIAAAEEGVPTVMELGGQDAAIVRADADLEVAASGLVWASFVNGGQACCSVERVYVHEDAADRFERLFVEKARRMRPGRDVPPVPESRIATVRRLAEDARALGARWLLGPAEDDGAWPPFVLEGRTPEMALSGAEIFGPMLTISRVVDDEEAVRRANEEGENLTASIWTTDRSAAERIAGSIRAGSIAINDHGVGEGAVWGAWGGVGASGHGRLHGLAGIREFTVPVHVTSSLTPRRTRVWWFPNDEPTAATLRAAVDVVGRPFGTGTLRSAATAVRHAIRALRRTV